MKTKILKIIILFTILVSCFSGLSVHASTASDILKQDKAFANEAKIYTEQDPRAIVAMGVKIFLGFVGTICLTYLVYAGYLIMTAGGDSDKIDKGKNIVKYGTIGIIIVLGSYGMVILLNKYLNPTDNTYWSSSSLEGDVQIRLKSENEQYTGCNTSDPYDPNCAGQGVNTSGDLLRQTNPDQ